MCGLKNSDTCEILLDTDGKIRFLSLELREETRARGSHQYRLGVLRGAAEACMGLEGWSEFARNERNWGDFGRKGRHRVPELGSGKRRWERWVHRGQRVGQAVRPGKSGRTWLICTGLGQVWGTKQHKVSGAILASPAHSLSPSHFTLCLLPTSPSSSISSSGSFPSFLPVFFLVLSASCIPPFDGSSPAPSCYSHPPSSHNECERSRKQKIILTNSDGKEGVLRAPILDRELALC